MTRRVARPTLALLMILTLLPALAAPGATAQSPPAPAPAAQPFVLSLQDALKASLENNLDIVVRSYDPLQSESRVILSESFLDPFFTGSASNTLDQESRVSPLVGPFSSSDRSHAYNIRFEDPLLTGGRYRIDLNANDDSTKRTLFGVPSQNKGYNTQYLLTFIQPLLRNFGKAANRALILVAHNNLGIDEARFRQTVLDTLSATEKAYWDLNFAIMDLK